MCINSGSPYKKNKGEKNRLNNKWTECVLYLCVHWDYISVAQLVIGWMLGTGGVDVAFAKIWRVIDLIENSCRCIMCYIIQTFLLFTIYYVLVLFSLLFALNSKLFLITDPIPSPTE